MIKIPAQRGSRFGSRNSSHRAAAFNRERVLYSMDQKLFQIATLGFKEHASRPRRGGRRL